MKVVLDTQLIYHLAGIFVNQDIDNTELEKILASNECCVSSLSIVEIVSRFSENRSEIKKALKPLFDRAFNLISIGVNNTDNMITKDDINRIYYTPDSEDLSELLKNIKVKKINYEAETLRFFLYLLLLASIRLIEDQDNSDRLDLYEHYLQEEMPEVLSSFRDTLLTGYNNNEIDKVIKPKFTSVFIEHHNFILFLKYLAMNQRRCIKKIKISKILDTMKNDPLYIKDSEESPILILKKVDNANLNKYLSSDLSAFFNQTISNESNIEFINLILEKLLIRGAKFKKNDIIDMLILNNISLNQTNVLTIDEASFKYLIRVGHQQSVQMIQAIFPRYR